MTEIAGVEIPNHINELTIEQFDKLNAITRDDSLDNIEKYIAKFVYLGVPEDAFDEMDFEDFKQCILNFNDSPPYPTEKVLSFEFDGYTYEANETIGVRDLGLIEKCWKQNTDNFASEALAILYKRTDLTKKEHYSNAHIKHKAKIFKSQKAEMAVPFVLDIIRQLTDTAQKLNEATEELESDKG